MKYKGENQSKNVTDLRGKVRRSLLERVRDVAVMHNDLLERYKVKSRPGENLPIAKSSKESMHKLKPIYRRWLATARREELPDMEGEIYPEETDIVLPSKIQPQSDVRLRLGRGRKKQ
jgi:hypothetical protein